MEINRLSCVRKRANNLYKKYGLSIPVDLDIIIQKKHIEVSYEENQLGIDGFCKLQNDPPQIILNTEITYEPRRRFTMAHEIGHICIPWHTGIDLCSLDNPYIKIQGQQMVNTQELEANIFASELLMPTKWLKGIFELNPNNLQDLILQVCHMANTSIMACLYALENVLPENELIFVKADSAEYWKQFQGTGINCFSLSATNAIFFYDKVCYWKEEFHLSKYHVIHYKISPVPNFATLNEIYQSCHSNIEELLIAISGGNPISVIPYIEKIIGALDDKYYVVISIENKYLRHFRHPETEIRMHSADYNNIDNLYYYIQNNFNSFGRFNLSLDSCMIWVKECWRGGTITNSYVDSNELLKIIVDELYLPEESHHMLQSINGVISSINSRHKTATREELYHFAKMRFETIPKYKEFANHDRFEEYISGKTSSLIVKRKNHLR